MSTALTARALALHRAGRLDEAQALYRDVLADDPMNADALHLLGVLARQQGDPGQAVQLIRQALSIAPDIADAHYNLANALNGMGQADQAEAHYRQALALRPLFPEAEAALNAIVQERRLDGLRTTLDRQYADGQWTYLNHSIHECARFGIVAAYVRQACAKGGVLELGCGQGTLFGYLGQDLQARYHGVDISQVALAKARANGIIRPLHCSPLETYQPSQLFDVILFNEVLLYVDQPWTMVERYRPWLNRGGAMVVSWYRMAGEAAEREERLWRSIQEGAWDVVDASELRNLSRQSLAWTVKLFRPSQPAGEGGR